MPPSSSLLPGEYRLVLSLELRVLSSLPFAFAIASASPPSSPPIDGEQKGEAGHPFCRAGAEVLGHQLLGLHLMMHPSHPTVGNRRNDHVLLLAASGELSCQTNPPRIAAMNQTLR